MIPNNETLELVPELHEMEHMALLPDENDALFLLTKNWDRLPWYIQYYIVGIVFYYDEKGKVIAWWKDLFGLA